MLKTYSDFKQILGIIEDIRREQPDAVILNEFMDRRHSIKPLRGKTSANVVTKAFAAAKALKTPKEPDIAHDIIHTTRDKRETAHVKGEPVSLIPEQPVPLWPILEGVEEIEEYVAPVAAQINAELKTAAPKVDRSRLSESLDRELTGVQAEIDAQVREQEEMIAARKARR